MIIQINTDSNITVNGELAEQIRNQVRNSLERYGEQITRVEAHLSDENSNKKSGTEDKRCLLEVRLAGLSPIAVSHQAETVEQAMGGAVDQLVSLIDTTIGKLDNR
jgi:ribosome-associated translation inhibitor RaiA